MTTTAHENLEDEQQKILDTAKKAIETGLSLEVIYDGVPRVVEVHAVGISTAGKPCMRVYQVQGASHSNEKEGWKLMSLGKVQFPHFVDIKSAAPREGYSKGDRGMKEIFTEV